MAVYIYIYTYKDIYTYMFIYLILYVFTYVHTQLCVSIQNLCADLKARLKFVCEGIATQIGSLPWLAELFPTVPMLEGSR